jgi:hypothetical protein
LRVPNGCSTVCCRTPMASGMRSSWSCILSSTSSCSQRLMDLPRFRFAFEVTEE